MFNQCWGFRGALHRDDFPISSNLSKSQTSEFQCLFQDGRHPQSHPSRFGTAPLGIATWHVARLKNVAAVSAGQVLITPKISTENPNPWGFHGNIM
jgi:hypothetical protein